jgi:hypothetical protein
MSYIGGYISDWVLNDQNLVGDFPVDHAVGGFGTAAGTGSNYTLSLNTPISAYRQGMPLEAMFGTANTGPVTINVDGLGPKAIMKVSASGALTELAAGDLAAAKMAILVYDGAVFQLANACCDSAAQAPPVPPASDAQPGIIRIATAPEAQAGIDDTTAITPMKMRVALNQQQPAGATEAAPGIIRIASQAEALAGTDNTTAVTPMKMKSALNQQQPAGASETSPGIIPIANQAEALAGTIDTKALTPLKLQEVLTQQLKAATEAALGLVSLATQTDVNTGTDNNKAVTSFKLAQYLNSQLAALNASQSAVQTGTDDSHFITPLKLTTLLNTKIKPMRATIKTQTNSEAESALDMNVLDAQGDTLVVAGLPPGAIIHQAALSWEGYLRNTSADQANGFGGGNMSFGKEGSQLGVFISLAGKVQLEAKQAVFYRLVQQDVTASFMGNGNYTVKLSGVSAGTPTLVLAGHWILELDIETP